MNGRLGNNYSLTTPLEPVDIQHAMAVLKDGSGSIVFNGIHDSRLAAHLRETGTEARKLFSQIGIVRFPDRTILVTDGFVHPQPDIRTLTGIIQNAIATAGKAGVNSPKVAVLSAVELVSPQMDSAVPAAVMEAMGSRGPFGKDVSVEGPLSMDVALSGKAADEKKVHTPVAGNANILVGHIATIPMGIIAGWMRFARPLSVVSVLTDGRTWHPFLINGMSEEYVEQTLTFCGLA